ncbi:hypothetical protein ADL26_08780 [Thermoactinomyces vulgaris]|jgi:hypothetical protein|nr:hypothetical protein ADL26_08780 [Thermoactinomyces vulgaris]
MEQLTQEELLKLEELLELEALSIKKTQAVINEGNETEWEPLLTEALTMHKQHLQQLLDQLRNHSGQARLQH